jgi:hypothetical protein
MVAGHRWLTPFILATTQENCSLKPAQANKFARLHLKKKKNLHKKGLVEWLKV